MSTEPNCFACPVGAYCDKHIQALPNYWGYKDQYDLVTMIRYPNGYCCQDDKTCKGIDSCNKHRTGPLCGKCEGNWTESLFSSQCIPVKHCSTTDIIVLYIVCAIAHALGLMELNYAKDVGSSVLKILLGAKDRTIPCRRGKQNFPIDAHKLKAENASKRVCSSKRKTKKSLKYSKRVSC